MMEIWGILNITEDSFSDGGRFLQKEAALSHARKLVSDGADVIDVGGASSRPRGAAYGQGAPQIPASVELARVLPVVDALVQEGIRVSVDTFRPEVAEAVLRHGAFCINDVSMGRSEELLHWVAAHRAELVLMHTRAIHPAEMGEVAAPNTTYTNLFEEVFVELKEAKERALACGIEGGKIWIDPGLGFAKNAHQSTELLKQTPRLDALRSRILIGASRKAFLAEITCGNGVRSKPDQRLGASLAAVQAAHAGRASAVRVHDVFETKQYLRALDALAI